MRRRAKPGIGGHMRKSLALLGVAAAAVLLATSAFAGNRGVSFTGIGFIQGPVCVGGPNAGNACTTNANCPGSSCRQPASQVWEISPDGTNFLVSPTPNGSFIVKWTPESGWGDFVGTVGGTVRLSDGGTVMSNGLFPGSNPAYAWPGEWAGAQDVWNPIPSDPGYAPCGNSRLSFFDMAGEGDYATGLTWQGCNIARAFQYDKATNTTVQLSSPNGRNTRGNAVSADGSTVTGWSTIAQGLRRGGQWINGAFESFGDPNGEDVKECVQTGGGCTTNSNSPTSGCPEYVDDASCTNIGTCQNRGTCQNKGVCTQNICVGGLRAGLSCTNTSQCPGACGGGTNPGTSCTNDNVCAGACVGGTNPGTSCTAASNCTGSCVGGPSNGANCASNTNCPDTLVCANNPNWTNDLYKGEAYDATPDGQYAVGRSFDMGTKFQWGYRKNPDGTFTEIAPPATWPYLMDPFRVSADGKTAVGRAGDFFTGTVPMFWREGVGTVDLQLFLIAQGLDELYFWGLLQASAVSADGTVMGGYGIDPDGRIQGWIVDISKLWVCHTPPGHPEDARTLGIDIAGAADHVAHGDFLGTCEFQASGALSRAVESREGMVNKYKAMFKQPSQVTESSSAWELPALKVITKPGKGQAKRGDGPRQKPPTRD